MKKLILLGACLLALGDQPLLAAEPEVVVVRIWEEANVRVAISRGGKEEFLTFDTGNSELYLKRSATGYQQVIQKLYSEGFRLQSTFGGAGTNTLVFVKG